MLFLNHAFWLDKLNLLLLGFHEVVHSHLQMALLLHDGTSGCVQGTTARIGRAIIEVGLWSLLVHLIVFHAQCLVGLVSGQLLGTHLVGTVLDGVLGG